MLRATRIAIFLSSLSFSTEAFTLLMPPGGRKNLYKHNANVNFQRTCGKQLPQINSISSAERCRSGLMSMQNDSKLNVSTIFVIFTLMLFLGSSFLSLSNSPSSFGRGGATVRVTTDSGKVVQRGVMTSLTRSEIQKKLSQLPLFFLKNSEGGIFIDDSKTGKVYMNFEDAKNALKDIRTDTLSIGATTMDDIWYSLIVKSGKPNENDGAGVAFRSDLEAQYKIVPSRKEVDSASKIRSDWKGKEEKDVVPLWLADRLAFAGGPGARVKIPMFTSLDDLNATWKRLKSDSPKESDSSDPPIQIITLKTVISTMEKGGTDARKLEFYPDIESVDTAEKLF